MTQVVIVVFDGLNEELVRPDVMPNLVRFTAEGVRLSNHRPVFPSVTRLNATAIVTGCFPGTHGLAANLSLVPEYHPTEPMDALEPQLTELRRRGGRVLFTPTLAEILADHGLEYIAAGVGTSGQAFVHHPNGEDATLGATIHTDYSLPRALHGQLAGRFGPWPEKALPNSARLAHLTDVFLEYVLAERNPAVALYWSSEPDSSQHGAGLHSPTVLEAARAADAEFGRVLAWLAAERPDANVIVTCDHGQSTIVEAIPLAQRLEAAGFAGAGKPGGVIVAGNGGSALFYVDGHDPAIAERLALWLMEQPWTGPLLASDRVGPIEGVVPQSLLGLDGDRAPDLALSFAWDGRANEHGQPGHVYSSGGAAGRGTHGSMSPWEFRTYTVARGPAFRAGETLDAPSCHVDLAPTVLHLLGLEVPPHMQGRAVVEAFAASATPADPPRTLETVEASRRLGAVEYRQSLVIARYPGAPAVLVSAEATREALLPQPAASGY